MSEMPALARSDAATAPARGPRRPAAPVRGTGRGSARGSSRSHLRVVTAAPRPPRRVPFVVLCSVVLAAGLLVVLLLNLQLAKGTYALHDLQRRSTILAEENDALTQRLTALEAPGVLAQRATELGMLPGSSPAFLRLPDGQVLGVPQAAVTAPTPEEGSTGETRATDTADTAETAQTMPKDAETAAGRIDSDVDRTGAATAGTSARRETPTSRSSVSSPAPARSGAASSGTPTGEADR